MSRTTKGLLALAILATLSLASVRVTAIPVETPDWVTKVFHADQEGIYKDGDSVVATSRVFAQANGNPTTALCPLKIFQFGSFGGSDCWGWRDAGGTEYAIMGCFDGIAFVNTSTWTVVKVVPGPQGSVCGGAYWRDIKTYQHYAYAASECTGTNQGIMIIDLQYLPDSVHYIKSFSTGTDIRSHNISIDTVKGYLYAVKQNYSGFRAINLADPVNPVEVSTTVTGDLHDIFAHNDTVYAAEANNHSFSIWNMANKAAGALLTRVTIPSAGYVHNIWPTMDKHYVVTTEETPNKTIKLWDVQNLASVQLKSQFLAPSNLAHNAHVQGNKLYLSHYESGVYVVDLSNPDTLPVLSFYDTYPASNTANFNGCWGVYPHTASGNVYGSNIEGQLYIFGQIQVTDLDTLRGDSLFANANSNVTIQVSVKNHLPIKSITIPFNWSGSYNMTFVGVNTTGLRTSYFQDQQFSAYDPTHGKIAYTIDVGSAAELPPGDGPVLNLILHIPPGASGPTNEISLNTVGVTQPSITTSCFSYFPELKYPAVTIGAPPSCCVGTRGNVDNSPDQAVDISDLTALIDHLYISFAPLACSQEANLDGSAENQIDISDLTTLIDKLYINPSSSYPACP